MFEVGRRFIDMELLAPNEAKLIMAWSNVLLELW